MSLLQPLHTCGNNNWRKESFISLILIIAGVEECESKNFKLKSYEAVHGFLNSPLGDGGLK
jgi:hypothetical protein